MPLQKQSVDISFQKGLDTKTDPFRVPVGNFLSLQNSVFTKGGLLQKRNGFAALTSLPDATSTFITTYNGNLTAVGNQIEAYASGSGTWVNKGSFQPLSLTTLPLIRNNLNQTQCDAALASNGLVCTVYSELNNSTTTYKYAIADSTTGQNIVAPIAIPIASGAITNAPRVFVMGSYFVIVFTNNISGTNHLQYVAINLSSPTTVGTNTDLSTTYTPATTLNFDGVVANNTLYVAYNSSSTSIKMVSLSSTLVVSSTVTFATRVATHMSVCADTTQGTPIIWAVFYNTGTTAGYVLAVNQNLTTVLAPTQIISSGTILNITAVASSSVCTVFYEVSNAYSYDSGIASNIIKTNTITQDGTVGTASTLVRSVGLASKAFTVGSSIYFLSVYSSTYQPSYFLINGSGQVVSQLAYSNGRGYLTTGLPSASISGSNASIGYLYKDMIAAANTTPGASVAPVYSQTGVNLVTFSIGTSNIISTEIGQNLFLSGGFLAGYDGYTITENDFFLYPDSVEVSGSTSGGTILAGSYYYSATYEWSDNNGNIYRSAPSIAVSVTNTGTTSSNTINVPTLRLTYKTANPVKIVIYRTTLSAGSSTFYQVTSLTAPVLNSVTADSVTFVDTLPDASIIGNNILYTIGGVLEDNSAPAFNAMTLFGSRLWGVDAEDSNLLWFSKQVIEATPVEMSDQLTLYVPPTSGAQGSTGPMTALSALDDKLIIFKRNAIYYLTGIGPDNTGANNDFSNPVFITSTVGCTNQHSIVFMPQGLMFQSDKGIWLLSRDLSTSYIGGPVEAYNSYSVKSALNIAGTNQVRFTLSNGVTLMYDYFYGQWGTFNGIPGVSSTLFQNMHTFINSFGQVYQESPGTYLDGANPVLLSFTTGWLNLSGLQAYQRAYFFYLLGVYESPHKLTAQIAYDYNSSPTQSTLITPINYSGPYGSDSLYGGSQYFGGQSNVEQWRVFLDRQKCEALQITINESYDSSQGVAAGAGLTLSGLNLIVGLKSSYPRIAPGVQTG